MPPKTTKRPPKKPTPKGAAAKPRGKAKFDDDLTDADGRIMGREVISFPLADLKTFPGNPRNGNVKGIAASMAKLNQYRTIVVREGTNHVLAGNHTYMATVWLNQMDPQEFRKRYGKAKPKHNFATIDGVYTRCSDDTAKAIVLADNRLPETGSTDQRKVAALLAEIEDVEGTGFSEEEAKAIVNAHQAALEEAMEDASLPSTAIEDSVSRTPNWLDEDDDSLDADVAPHAEDVPLSEWVPTDDAQISDDDAGDGADPLNDASEESKGVIQLKADLDFPGAGFMEIPVLLPEMMVEKLPENLLTWAGMPTRDWPDKSVWWWYNFGSERTFGMHDVSMMILAFYSHDDYFDNWWHYPDRYVQKALNSGVKMAVTPNFSCEDQPRALSLFALFKSRWLGRYMQEAGIRIIPDIEWRVGDREYLDTYVMAGIPRGLPYISIQAQNLDSNRMKDDEAVKAHRAQWLDDLKHIVDTLKPQTLIIYSNEVDFDWLSKRGLNCELHWQETRLSMWTRHAPKKEKRTTL